MLQSCPRGAGRLSSCIPWDRDRGGCSMASPRFPNWNGGVRQPWGLADHGRSRWGDVGCTTPTSLTVQHALVHILRPHPFPSRGGGGRPARPACCGRRWLFPRHARNPHDPAGPFHNPSRRQPVPLGYPGWDTRRGGRSRLGSGPEPICRDRMRGRTGDTMRGSDEGRAGTGTSRRGVGRPVPAHPESSRPGMSGVTAPPAPRLSRAPRPCPGGCGGDEGGSGSSRSPASPHHAGHSPAPCTCLAPGEGGRPCLQQPVRGQPGREGAGWAGRRGGSRGPLSPRRCGRAGCRQGSSAPGWPRLAGWQQPPRAALHPGAGRHTPSLHPTAAAGAARARRGWQGRGKAGQHGQVGTGMAGSHRQPRAWPSPVGERRVSGGVRVLSPRGIPAGAP